MNKSKLKQFAGIAILFGIAGFLFYYSTWTEERRLILSKASLKGKITYRGKPVPYALVILVGGDLSSTGAADAHGNYTVSYAPVGKVSVGVNTVAGRRMMMSATMAASQGGDNSATPSFLDVPEKFFDPKTSGITADVKDIKEPNTFDIDVK